MLYGELGIAIFHFLYFVRLQFVLLGDLPIDKSNDEDTKVHDMVLSFQITLFFFLQYHNVT
jgi:hypothetical protein